MILTHYTAKIRRYRYVIWMNALMAFINVGFIGYIFYCVPDLNHPVAAVFFMFHVLTLWINIMYAEVYRQRRAFWVKHGEPFDHMCASLKRITPKGPTYAPHPPPSPD